MFTVESSPYKKDSKVNQLIDTLIAVKQKGVAVEVILDQNIDFIQRKHVGEWETLVKSIRAYKRLREAGVRVFYDEPARYTHAKTIVIDGRMVILGSSNWTESAFDRSIEANVLVNSSELAAELLEYFKTIKIDTGIEKYLDSIGSTTPVAWDFMENRTLAPLMVKEQDQRAFEVYLLLLWKYDGNPEAKQTLFYDDVARYLGIYEGWTATAYRRQIIKVLKKLEQRYKLIRFEPRYAKEAYITLLATQTLGKDLEIREEQYFELPNDYFKFGWNRLLSFRAQFCYLINLANSSASDAKPFWSKSVRAITEQFGGISQDIINKGMGELRRRKLIEVSYDELNGNYEKRKPKVYKILPLYDPKELAAKLKGLEAKYGAKACGQARKYAEIVFEENNPDVVEDIILKTSKYGEAKIKKAFGIVAQKSIDNPKRSYVYVVGILEQIGGKHG